MLFTFVLHWVEEEGVVFLDYGQYGFTADGGPAAEDGRNFVFEDQILGFFSKEGPIGSRVDDHWFDLMAENSTFLVNPTFFLEKQSDPALAKGSWPLLCFKCMEQALC